MILKIFSFFVVFLSIAQAAIQPISGNLISDESFEPVAGDPYAFRNSWTATWSGTSELSPVPRTGVGAMRVIGPTVHAQPIRTPIQPGGLYRLSGYVRTDAGPYSYATLTINFYDANDELISRSWVTVFAGTSAYEFVSRDYRVPYGTANVFVSVDYRGSTWADYDDLSLVRLQ